MRKSILFFLLAISPTLFAQRAKIREVVTHNRTTVVTNPAVGTKEYPAWGVFPSAKTPIRQITLNLTLGSPDSLPTAHWDYSDRIILRKVGGKSGKTLNYTLGFMLTPYGNMFGKGWSWKWQADVSDFAPFLRDSVEMVYVHTGFEPASVGWALTLSFDCVEGPPAANPLGIVPLWNANFKYGDPAHPIQTVVLPVSYISPAGKTISRIRIQQTGHGMDEKRGCSEFCKRWRTLAIDGKEVDRRDLWKNCGENPLYPQGGTWAYKRGNWCPGDLQSPDLIDAEVSEGEHSVALEMEPYNATGKAEAEEDISAYLFQYSAPLKKADARLEKIRVPSDEQQFGRLNPACFYPRVVIRNLGSAILRSATISYGTEGFAMKTYHWTGELKFNATADIVLPGEVDFKQGVNRFTAVLTKPNGKNDEWTGDNSLTSIFTAPTKMPKDFVVAFLTNNRPKDNTLFVVNTSDTVFIKHPNELKPATLYQDTIHLREGKYEICLTDSAGDGLEFWAEPQNGAGYLRLLDLKGNLIHAFTSDCGSGEKLAFVADAAYATDTIKGNYAVLLYPRLTDDVVKLNLFSNKWSKIEVRILVNEKEVERHEYANIKNGTFEYSLRRLPKGRVMCEVWMDGVRKFKEWLKKN